MDGPVRPRPKKESTILGNLVVQVTDVKHEKIFNAQRDKKTKMHFIDYIAYFPSNHQLNKDRTGPWSTAKFKPNVHSRSKLMKCPEEGQLK